MSVITRTGAVLLNPSEKSHKYSMELKSKKALTNDFHRKMGDDGKQIKLTKEQLAYRAGYLTACSDSQKCFKSNHPNYKSNRKKIKI